MALHIPLKWLSEHVELSLPPEALAERLTVAGLEVESVTAIGEGWEREKVVVGRIAEVKPHPDADRLCLAVVDYGGEAPLTVVTGAPNVARWLSEPMPAEPLKVPFAMVGAELIDGHADDGRTVRLKPTKIRGVASEGMVCSERELGLSEEHEGILYLPADAPTGEPLADYLGDHVLEFDIKGGFAHLQSVYGIAREVAALTGQPLRPGAWQVGREVEHTVTPTPGYADLEIADADLCRRYVGLCIEGLRVGPSPFWMQQRLKRAGMRPINAVVDVTNYVMMELGQPLHAFDYHKLRPGRGEKPLVRVRRAAPGERMRTLDGVERTFDADMLLITDGAGPVGIAGVMGGEESEVGEATTAVLLESANFEFLNNRRTTQLLKLRTEASDRFGKNLDPEQCLAAALRAAYLITGLCGGRVSPQYGDVYPAPPQPRAIELEPGFVRGLLGLEVPRADIVGILERLEFRVEDGEPLRVTPPSHRKDVAMPADLVEEVGRIYGYDRMQPTLLADALPPQRRSKLLDTEERIRDLLTGCGLDEIITYSITARNDERKLYPGGSGPGDDAYVGLRNPLDAERGHLRRRLLPGVLATARANLRFQRRVAVFEVGRVFHPVAGHTLPEEPRRVCAVLTGPREAASWLAGPGREPFDFYDIKGVTEALLAGLEIEGARWERGEEPAYHPGRSARLLLDGGAVGHLGELHPKVVAAFDLRPPVIAMELDVETLAGAWNEDKQLAPASSHPPVYEDMAFLVDADVPAERVQALIAQTGRPLLKEVALFDVYADPERLGEHRKSLAYALTYQADDRTLTDKEVAKVRDKIARRLEKELGATLRAGG